MKQIRIDSRRGASFQLALIGLLLLVFGISPEQAFASRGNFAKYQKVAASSQSSTYNPDFATDGIVGNFDSFRTGNTGPHWLEILFPRPVTLASAHLYLGLHNVFNSSNVLLNFKLQYHDGSGWVDVPGGGVTGNSETEVNLIFTAAVTADRVRLWSDDSGSRVIREIAMFPPNVAGQVEQGYPIGTDVRLSVAHKRPAVATTINSTNYPKLAVDGYVDDASRWVSGNASLQSLEIDLLVTNIIRSAHLYTGFGNTSALSDFTLQYLNGTNWVDIPGASITGNTNTALVIPFDTNISASQIRLVNSTSSFTRVKEVLVFPPRTGGYPLGQDAEMSAPPTAKWDDYADSSYRLRCGIADGRFLGFYDGSVRFAAGSQPREALGFQLLLNHRDGSYRIRHAATGKCLAPSQISSLDQDQVILEDYTGLPHQDWFLQAIDATYFRILNAYNGMALQTRYGDWITGNPMAVRPVDGSDLQRWYTQDPIMHPKKGIAASKNIVPWGTETFMYDTYRLFSHCSWSYSWGRQSSEAFPYMTANHTYNPMQWGNYSWTHGSAQGPPENLHRELQSNAKPVHYMGFNEPEHATQGNISVSEAIRRWPRLEALGVPMVAPVPASIQVNSTVSPALPAPGWMSDFVNQADALGYRREVTAVHSYAGPNAANLINKLEDIYQAYGKPIWLTEFSVVDWNGTANWTKAGNYNFLSEFMWRAESLPWLKRYSLFQYVQGSGSGFDLPTAPRSNTRNIDGSLTAFGELYAGWDGVTNVLPGKVYHVHNRGAYRRLRNPATGDTTLTSSDPEVPAAGSHWYLTPGGTTNTYRLISTRDGRLLHYADGGAVSLAASTTTVVQTEWRLAANVDGWYFLEHSQSNKRLGDNGNGTFSMGAISSSTDTFKWRFVVPAVADNELLVVNAGTNHTVTLSPTLWTPAAISTRAWYDAADTNSMTLESGKVSQWNDRSGSANHAVQTNAVRQPAYQPADPMVNNLPSVGDLSTNGAIGLDTPLMSARNIYVVTYYKDGVDSTYDVFSTLLSGPGSFGTSRVMGNINTDAFIGSYSFNTAGTYKNGSTSNTNAVLPMPGSILKLKSTSPVSQVYSLGYNTWADNRDWQGYYSEWIFTDGTEDAATEQKIEGYLAHKWGLINSLPSGHAYKNALPTGGATATNNLNGSASNPGGGTVTAFWTLLAGPAPVSFGDSSALNTTVTFSTNGVYILRLTAESGYSSSVADVTITVHSLAYGQWLVEHFGITGIDESMLSSNGVNTVREAYIAGLNPTNPAARFSIEDLGMTAGPRVLEWTGVTGRLYTVYWSSNILNGFELLQTDIRWDIPAFTDTVHQAEQKGFYRIEVTLDE